MKTTTQHWTERNADAFVHRIATDFSLQIENRMEVKAITHTKLADSLGITTGRVSQILNRPGNLTLRNIVRFSRSLGMKVAIVAYDDGDAENRNGPINSGIFSQCWQNSGRPTDFFSIAKSTSLGYVIISSQTYSISPSVNSTTTPSQTTVTGAGISVTNTGSGASAASTWPNSGLQGQSITPRDLQLTKGGM